MLHVAAWPTGVHAWTRILSLKELPEMSEAHADKLLTQASVLAATGQRLPAHLRDAHPGFELGLRVILDCLLPVPLRTYLTEVLSPTVAEESGWLMASADPSIRDATRKLHIIGHSAGSFTAMVISNILQDPKFTPFFCEKSVSTFYCPSLSQTSTVGKVSSVKLFHKLSKNTASRKPTKTSSLQARNYQTTSAVSKTLPGFPTPNKTAKAQARSKVPLPSSTSG